MKLADLPRPLRRILSPLREGYLRVRYGRRGMPWTIHGVACRVPPALRARFDPRREHALAAYLAAHLRPGACLFDVGANVGAYVIPAAAWTAPAGRIVAFEPNPETAAVLARVVAMNALTPRVRVAALALSDREGEGDFHAVGTEGMSRLGRPNPLLVAQGRTVRVPMSTLDAWATAEHETPDWLLIDAEGHEGAVLDGARRTIGARGNRLGIVVEMHPSAWSDAGTSAQQLRALIEGLGRRAVALHDGDPYTTHGHVVLEPR